MGSKRLYWNIFIYTWTIAPNYPIPRTGSLQCEYTVSLKVIKSKHSVSLNLNKFLKIKLKSFFLKMFCRTSVLFWDHWFPTFGLLLMSALGFKAKVHPITCVPCCLRNLLVANMAAELFSSMYLWQVLMGLESAIYRAFHCHTVWDQVDAPLTRINKFYTILICDMA